MAIINWLHSNINEIVASISTLSKNTLNSYCQLETACNNNTLVSKDGSLISLIEVMGFHQTVGHDEYNYITNKIYDIFQPILQSEGHMIQICFSSLPECHDDLEKIISGSRLAASRLQLNIDSLFNSKKKTLNHYCQSEQCIIAIWTSPKALEKTQYKEVLKKKYNRLKAAGLPSAKNSQKAINFIQELEVIHSSLLSTINNEFNHSGFFIEIIQSKLALKIIRKMIEFNFTDETWEPHLPGDDLQFKENINSKANDISHLLWMPLDEQLFQHEAENIDYRISRIGDTLYAPISISLFPQYIKSFNSLFNKLNDTNIPWRISYTLQPNGISITRHKSLLAQFLAFSSYENKLIINSNSLLKDIENNTDEPVIKFNITFVTWAPENDQVRLKTNLSILTKIIQSWGGAQVATTFDDPLLVITDTIPALSPTPFSTPTAAPLSDVVKMLPFSRPASIWTEGSFIFRAPSGKLMPYQPGSKLQNSWIELIYAPSGSGKSVLANALNLSLCLKQENDILPYISIIDIGPSSQGLITLLKHLLPKEQADSVCYYRMSKNNIESINPFDTILGATKPTAQHKSFLINFISLLFLDKISDALPSGMSSMISMVIDLTYEDLSPANNPKLFNKEFNIDISRYFNTINKYPETWWEATDLLFESGQYALAEVAQKYAIPILSDTITIAHHYSITDLYQDVQFNNESYIQAYCRVISTIIRDYPNLIKTTNINFYNKSIISIDLEEMTSSGSDSADKNTAIYYMLARHIVAQKFFTNINDINSLSPRYKAYQTKSLKHLKRIPKKVIFDEFHRTGKSQSVREQTLLDMREGRKNNTQISLTSQSLKDFDELMIEFATSIFILGGGSDATLTQTCNTFNLNSTERIHLKNDVNGPTESGATLIAQFKTKYGTNTQLLTATFSPLELWSLSTTSNDTYIRNTLYNQIPAEYALSILAKKFPTGSVSNIIKQIMHIEKDKSEEYICNEIIKDITNKYYTDNGELSFLLKRK